MSADHYNPREANAYRAGHQNGMTRGIIVASVFYIIFLTALVCAVRF